MKLTLIKWKIILIAIFSIIHFNLPAETYDPSASVIRFQKQMAKRGNAESQFKLGLMYETGSGVKANMPIATVWYDKASAQHYKPAINRLTYLEIKKSGFKEKHKQWLKELKNDARYHEGEALFLLGQMYSEGTGVSKSLTRSLKLLRKAIGGNIPGSEAEIARVEKELSLLQNQYMTEEEKKKVPPVIIAPVIKSPAATTKTNIKITKIKIPAKKKSSPKKTVRKKPPVTKPKVARKKQPDKLVIKKAPVKKPVAVVKPEIKEEYTHPMDEICGGRNRFSRGCR